MQIRRQKQQLYGERVSSKHPKESGEDTKTSGATTSEKTSQVVGKESKG